MPPAARLTDMHTCPMVTGPVPHVGGPILPPCCPTVIIGGLPAARVGDMATCVGPPDVIVLGAFTTLIGGQPAARIGDMTAHGGVIVLGCPTVNIGDVGGGGAGSSFSGNMSAAKESASAFTSATATADSSRSSATPSEKPSDAERTLAAQPGTSPAHRAAREKVVRDFYQDRPGLGADRANQDLKGIDLNKPV